MSILKQFGIEPIGKHAPNPSAEKNYQTLRTKFAQAGFVLGKSRADDGKPDYFIERWGMIRYCDDLQAVERFLKQIGVAA